MLEKSVKYRRPLNSNQVRILKILYKFRFVTSDVLAEYLKKNKSTIYESLFVLQKQGYIAKRYDPSYRIRHRPASYSLANIGIRYLKEHSELNQATLRNFYKNKNLSEEQIDSYLHIAALYLLLKRQTGTQFDICTKYEMGPENAHMPFPILFLRDKSPDKPDYFIDYFPAGTFSWLLRRRIRQYQDISDEGNYRAPDVLFVAGNVSTEKRLFKLTYENYNDFRFLLTQESLLFNSWSGTVWIDVEQTEEDDIIRVGL